MAKSRIIKAIGKVMFNATGGKGNRSLGKFTAKNAINHAHYVTEAKAGNLRGVFRDYKSQIKESNDWYKTFHGDSGFYGHAKVSGHKTDSFYSNVSNPIGKWKC